MLTQSQLSSTQLEDASVQRASFPKTTTLFDWGLYVVQRMGELIWQGKYLVFGIGFLLFLIYELAHFAKFLLRNWNG